MPASFFYGTLMAPSIISRLLGRTIPSTDIHPEAWLPGYVRLHIENRDYPAVLTTQEAEAQFGSSFKSEEKKERGVQGVVVTGLSEREIQLLDAWEADEYLKVEREVEVEQGQKVQAAVYVWNMGEYGSLLQPRVWKYEEFMYVQSSLELWAQISLLKKSLAEIFVARTEQPRQVATVEWEYQRCSV